MNIKLPGENEVTGNIKLQLPELTGLTDEERVRLIEQQHAIIDCHHIRSDFIHLVKTLGWMLAIIIVWVATGKIPFTP
jgi:hypothetical protein